MRGGGRPGVLIVDPYRSTCGACGANVDPYKPTCHPIGYEPIPEPCGALYVEVDTHYMGGGVAAAARQLRPDLTPVGLAMIGVL